MDSQNPAAGLAAARHHAVTFGPTPAALPCAKYRGLRVARATDE